MMNWRFSPAPPSKLQGTEYLRDGILQINNPFYCRAVNARKGEVRRLGGNTGGVCDSLDHVQLKGEECGPKPGDGGGKCTFLEARTEPSVERCQFTTTSEPQSWSQRGLTL